MHRRHKLSKGKRKKPTSRNRLTYGIIAIAVILVCLLAYYSFHSANQTSNSRSKSQPNSPPKAALIDHLSFSSPPPNENLKTQCKTILENADFDYSYYEGERVTVDFYRNLPKYGYSLIILRVHSAVIKDEKGNPTNLIGLFTSEVYNETTVSQEYLSDLHEGRLALARLFADKDTYYFGITPWFVKFCMKGNFTDTVIIMMGCDGLNHTSMAEAFVQRGAKVYLSWTGPVTINHTDDAAIHLLQSLLEQNQTIRTAVELINPDPTYKSKLDYYPKEVGDDGI